MKLRSSTPAQNESSTDAPPSAPEKAQSQPLTLLTLPDDISAKAWITNLGKDGAEGPTSSTQRYMCCPDTGKFLEITEISTAKDTPRSWLITPERERERSGGDSGSSIGDGHITQRSDLHVATPVDPLFLLLLVVIPTKSVDGNLGKKFLAMDDYEDILVANAPGWSYVLEHEKLRSKVLERLQSMCDETMAGDEKMYRPSIAQIAKQFLAKARKVVKYGLPRSLELEFVQKMLQIHQTTKISSTSQETIAEDDRSSGQGVENENSIKSENTEDREHSRNETNPFDNTEELTRLQRLKVAINLILSYTEPHIREQLLQAVNDDESIDFKPLDLYLAHARSLRQEATALRAMSDNISRKRPATDEVLEVKAEKKRRKEEEEKKKKLESRAVKNLKKVNTTGMMKLNSFFRKAG